MLIFLQYQVTIVKITLSQCFLHARTEELKTFCRWFNTDQDLQLCFQFRVQRCLKFTCNNHGVLENYFLNPSQRNVLLLFLPFENILLLGFRHGRRGSLTFLNEFSVFTKRRYKVNNFGHTYSNRVWLVMRRICSTINEIGKAVSTLASLRWITYI